MKRYMLDTNVVSDFLRRRDKVEARVTALPSDRIFISSIVAAELLHGVTRRPEATYLNELIGKFLARAQILPWDGNVAHVWGRFRTSLENSGRMLAPHDMLIAAHAIAEGMVLVSNDRAFENIDALELENWAV